MDEKIPIYETKIDVSVILKNGVVLKADENIDDPAFNDIINPKKKELSFKTSGDKPQSDGQRIFIGEILGEIITDTLSPLDRINDFKQGRRRILNLKIVSENDEGGTREYIPKSAVSSHQNADIKEKEKGGMSFDEMIEILQIVQTRTEMLNLLRKADFKLESFSLFDVRIRIENIVAIIKDVITKLEEEATRYKIVWDKWQNSEINTETDGNRYGH